MVIATDQLDVNLVHVVLDVRGTARRTAIRRGRERDVLPERILRPIDAANRAGRRRIRHQQLQAANRVGNRAVAVRPLRKLFRGLLFFLAALYPLISALSRGGLDYLFKNRMPIGLLTICTLRKDLQIPRNMQTATGLPHQRIDVIHLVRCTSFLC